MLPERVIKPLLFACATCSALIVFSIFAFIFKEAFPFMAKHGATFITGLEWRPTPLFGEPKFGILPMILGTIYMGLGALAIAVPIGIGTAIYVAEYAPAKFRSFIRSLTELLVSIPSVVLGFLGLVLIVPWLRGQFGGFGFSILAGAIVLAVMTLPHIVCISEDALKSVPIEFRSASLALGATRLQTLLHVSLPYAKSGILASIILGLGNAIGETMAVLMVVGNPEVPFIPQSILEPVRVLTSTIVLEMGYAVWGSEHTQALFAIGVILFLMVVALNAVATAIVRREIVVKPTIK